MITIIIISMLLPVIYNCSTHLRALLVLHDRGILAHVTSVTGHQRYTVRTVTSLQWVRF
jgi:hypothetical protein